MANPSNYRYDAYSDIPSNITLTERHLIPAISPYIVTLNEVPVKSAPSTTVVKYINDIPAGVPAYGDTLVEVSATPVAGQYYPDYHTNADSNENWNTGQILFAAADAGRTIEVTYLAKGTLTGVSCNMYPSWWCDRGDGSDGDFYPTSNVTLKGRYDFRSVYIPAGVTVYVAGFIDIRCQGMFINAGLINGDGKQSRDFTYIENVIEANLKACLAPSSAAGQAFNIAYGGREYLINIYYGLTKALGVNMEPEFGPNRAGDIKHSNADISKAKELLGYEPDWSFEKGIEAAIQWYKENL